MRAPDFLAFPIVKNKPLPVLIEVKSQQENRLDWSAEYLATIRRFADSVGLPLLVAWKAWDIWTLVDVAHFERNVTGYRLTLENALREDLSCVLFRNVRVQMNPDLALVFTMRILDGVAGDADTLLPEGWLKMQVAKAGYYRNGTPVTEYNPRHSTLFLAAADNAELRRTGKQECEQIFRPQPDHSFTLSNVLVAQLSLEGAGESIDWHRVLTQPLSSSGAELRDSLQAAIDCGFVRYVMDIIPNTWPRFVPK